MPSLPDWIVTLLNFIGSLVCHQNPKKTLVIGGRFLPVCARCTGAYLGLLIGYAVIMYRKKEADGPPNIWAVSLLSMPMIIDSVLQALAVRGSTNVLRLITGLFFGVALLPFLIYVLRLIPTTQHLPIFSTLSPEIPRIDNIRNPWVTAKALLLGALTCLGTFLAINCATSYSQPYLYWIIALPTFFSIIIHIFLLPALIFCSLAYHFLKS